MFAIKGLESLNNLSTFLTVPLFAAGYITTEKTTLELENPASFLFEAVIDVLYCSVPFVMIIVLIIVSSQLPKVLSILSSIVFFLFAFTCLSVGLCKIPMLVMSGIQGSIHAHDIFWSLGYITGGFTIIRVAGTNLQN